VVIADVLLWKIMMKNMKGIFEMKHNKILAIVPIRAGSKRLLDKNIKPFAGKPLFAITLDTALKSKHITDIVVTTDCPVTKQICKQKYPKVKVIDRPEELATDDALSIGFIKHVMQTNQQRTIVLLQVTSPLRTTEQIDDAIEYFYAQGQLSLVSGYYDPTGFNLNGAIYINKRSVLENCSFGCYKYPISKFYMMKDDSIDIDTEEEFYKAEGKYNDNR